MGGVEGDGGCSVYTITALRGMPCSRNRTNARPYGENGLDVPDLASQKGIDKNLARQARVSRSTFPR
jgi:hypothetical protein